jgi:choline dehydrogenase-like flavoprotein
MGAVTDPRAVLDSRCRVLGLEGLRVADASSLPSTPRANNHLTCVMLAEHVAQQIELDRQNHAARAL